MMGYDIREVLPEVFRIPVPLEGNPLKELNSYLFRGSREAKQRNLLVDTGFRTEGCKKALLKGLGQLGVSMEDTDILLTHLHADHSGNAPELIRPGGRVYISREDYRFMDGTLQEHRSERFRENGIEESLLQAMLACTPSRTMAAPLSFRDYTLLEEGDMILAGTRCGPSGHRDIHQGISALKSAVPAPCFWGITCCLTLRPISQTGGMCRTLWAII